MKINLHCILINQTFRSRGKDLNEQMEFQMMLRNEVGKLPLGGFLTANPPLLISICPLHCWSVYTMKFPVKIPCLIPICPINCWAICSMRFSVNPPFLVMCFCMFNCWAILPMTFSIKILCSITIFPFSCWIICSMYFSIYVPPNPISVLDSQGAAYFLVINYLQLLILIIL
jgi:hypothetical protein